MSGNCDNSKSRFMNRLKQTKSDYLRQHAQNPVHWWPWCDEAFARAQSEKKLVLVSIGYSSCHWCHVMEHESFEDREVAEILNHHFIAIKVDREEHPHVDKYYMDALHLMTARGGWPLNMFALPSRQAVLGGTYFPKKKFMEVLRSLSQSYASEPEKFTAQATHLQQRLLEAETSNSSGVLSAQDARGLRVQALAALRDIQLRQYDPEWGGFGRAPKFPRSHSITAMLEALFEETHGGHRKSLEQSIRWTLRCMAYGGLRDHLAGGFHRYSTDDRWLVPHFEKMLYDQALLLEAYAHAASVLKEPVFVDVVSETLAYLNREMKDSHQFLSSAQDADSEGKEGAHFVWTFDEISSLLNKEKLWTEFVDVYQIAKEGNWDGVLVLAADPYAEWERVQKLQPLRRILYAIRERREKPFQDRKIISSWNLLCVSSQLKAALALQSSEPQVAAELRNSAVATLNSFEAKVAQDGGSLAHVYYGSPKQALDGGPMGQLEDYVFLVRCLQFQAWVDNDFSLAERAAAWLNRIFDLFWVNERFSPVQQAELGSVPVMDLEDQDGAMPAAMSVLCGVLLRQALFTPDSRFLDEGLRLMKRLETMLQQAPHALSFLLSELDALDCVVVKGPERVSPEMPSGMHFNKLIYFKSVGPYQLCDIESCFFSGVSAAEAAHALVARSKGLSVGEQLTTGK